MTEGRALRSRPGSGPPSPVLRQQVPFSRGRGDVFPAASSLVRLKHALDDERTRLNRTIRKVEEFGRQQHAPRRAVRVSVGDVTNVLGWTGEKLTWNGTNLTSCKDDVRVLAAAHVSRVIRCP